MSATYLGSLALSAAVPGAAVGLAAGADGINAAFPDITARVAALQAQLTALATMPPMPSFPELRARAANMLAQLDIAIATPGLPPAPSLVSAIAALAALVSDLLAMSADLSVKLGTITALQGQLAAGGVHAIAYSGDAASLGADVQAALPGAVSGSAHALALVTTNSATWAAMGAVFKVTP